MSARNQSCWPERLIGTKKFLKNHRRMMLLQMGKAQTWTDEAASAHNEARSTYVDAPTLEIVRLMKEAGEHLIEALNNLSKQHDKADDLNNRGVMWFDKEVEGVWSHWLSDDEQ